MEPKIHNKRTAETGEQHDIRDINDTKFDVFMDDIEEDGALGFVDDGSDETQEYIEDLRIEALKRAIDIAKLMSNVTADDIINLADKLVIFIKDTEI